jgi:hypothetical protein
MLQTSDVRAESAQPFACGSWMVHVGRGKHVSGFRAEFTRGRRTNTARLSLPSVCLLGGGDERERERACRIVQRKRGTSQRLPGHGRCTFGKSYLISDAATLDSTVLMFEHFCVPRGPLDPAHDLMVDVGTISRRGKCSKR